MPEHLTLSVSDEDEGARIDVYLAGSALELSRQCAQRLIRDGNVTIAGQPIKRPSHRVTPGEVVDIEMPDPVPTDIEPENIPLKILFEDRDMLVIDKPGDLCVHPAPSRRSGTLVNGLLYYMENSGGGLSSIGGVLRPGIVHRLDQGTSGVIVVAKNDAAHKNLSEQFHDRRTEKSYTAVVDGSPGWDRKEIDEPVGRDPRHRKRMAIVSGGRPSQTSLHVLARRENLAIVEAVPHTGRTHQIRVHLRHAGCSVANDDLYRSHTYRGRLQAKIRAVTGLLLHASSLSLYHPADGAKMTFEAPLPEGVEAVTSWIRNAQKNEPS